MIRTSYDPEADAMFVWFGRAASKVEGGMVGLVNLKTDYCPRATTEHFSSRET